jgi:myo-inositol-1(or 4)-monophosphatase
MQEIETILKQAALSAGKSVIQSIPTEGVMEKEGRANFVTAADLASEKIIMDLIRQNFPTHDILSEETTSEIANPLETEHLWVIDPIDGTSNFRYERGYSSISIGYVERGVIKASAVYDPFREQLFFASQGKGSSINGRNISTSTLTDIARATIATDNSYDPAGTKHNLELMLKVNPTPWYMMRGSAVLSMCDAAAGRVDMYFHTSLKPWDNAAAFLIAEEAGAVVVGMDGNKTNFLSDNVIIGNRELVNQFLGSMRS